jgi:hypothetical protein
MTKVAFQSQTDCLWENACLVCSSLPPVVCGRTHVLFVRLYLQLFVGGSMSCLFVFTSSCLWEEACLVCSSLPPVVCGRKHVLFVRLYLQLFVGGSMSCLFVFTSSCLWEEACLVGVICVCLRIMVSSTFCVVFLFFFVLCALCCRFLWIVPFDCHFDIL